MIIVAGDTANSPEAALKYIESIAGDTPHSLSRVITKSTHIGMSKSNSTNQVSSCLYSSTT
jgi:hypothetical protein